METASPQRAYRPEIDGLRALAVLPVVVYHAFPGRISGGFVGVDMFLVISGYLITLDILHRQTSDSFSVLGFYRRRIHRLVPALALVLSFCLVVGMLTLFDGERRVLMADLAASSAFVLNHWLIAHLGYFDVQAPLRPLLHLWSLAVEEQFYIVWPALLVWMRVQRASSRLTMVSLLALASFACCLWLQAERPVAAYYLLSTRAWQFLAGALLALHQSKQAPERTMQASPWAVVLMSGGALSVAGSMLLIHAQQAYPGLLALPPTLGTLAMLAGAPGCRIGARLLSQRWLVGVGRISYPLYLWHWPLLSFLRIYAGGNPTPSARLLAIVLACVLAWLTTHCLEKRLRPITSRRRTAALMLSVCMLGIAGLIGALGWLPERHSAQADAQRLRDVALYELPKAGPGCDPRWLADLPPGIVCQQHGALLAQGAVIGDSHAHHLFAGLQQADPAGHWRVLSISSCPPLVGVLVQSRWTDCADLGEQLVRRVALDPNIATVVLSFQGGYPLDTNLAAEHVLTGMGPAEKTLTDMQQPAASKRDAFAAGLRRSVALLQDAGKRVVVVIDVPELPFEPRGCLERPLLGRQVRNCSVLHRDVVQRQSVLREVLATIANERPGMRLFDTLEVLCVHGTCPIERDGVIVMRDSHHLSARGSARVVAALIGQLSSP